MTDINAQAHELLISIALSFMALQGVEKWSEDEVKMLEQLDAVVKEMVTEIP